MHGPQAQQALNRLPLSRTAPEVEVKARRRGGRHRDPLEAQIEEDVLGQGHPGLETVGLIRDRLGIERDRPEPTESVRVTSIPHQVLEPHRRSLATGTARRKMRYSAPARGTAGHSHVEAELDRISRPIDVSHQGACQR